jgi:hypothetical protein
MTTEDQAEIVRQMIKRFFAIANMDPPAALQINEGVAAVFGVMLQEAAKCSNALNFVPRPPLGVATLGWLGSQAARAALGTAWIRLSRTCVVQVIRTWRSKLEIASNNVSYGRSVAMLGAV